MPHGTSKGDDLERVIREAVQDFLDTDDVKVRLTVPSSLDIREVEVRVEGEVNEITTDDESGDDESADDREEDEDEADDESEDSSEGPTLDEEADAAADFVEGILDALDLPGHLKIRIVDEEDQAEVEVVDVGSGALIGRRGQTLEAIQELLRSALQREFQRRSRVKVDVEGYRARRLEKLLEKAEDAIEDVLDSGDPERLEPMDVFERKAIHRLVASYDGVSSRSQGREPSRRVVIEPE
jgi:spoIIIJ-associated protein